MKKLHDHYFMKAKKEGRAARSVYKLEEIDKRHRVLAPGMAILDLGCRPGSWLQYAAERVGKNGLAVGIDLSPVEIDLPAHCRTLVMDALAPDLDVLRGLSEAYAAVLSDMAPSTTGVRFVDQMRSMDLCEAALAIAGKLLVPGGHLVVKIFQGPGFQEFLAEVRSGFDKVVIAKPQSSRKESKEIYIVGLRFKGEAERQEPGPPPSRG
jgi:23S rRNA (uridine2552-2'-O)-methyltransferase